MNKIEVYHPKNKIRIVTAASLFDGHDAAINIMRRIIQSSGAEVIHLGHDRSVLDVVDCAIQEDVQAIAMTSYQGGHVEYFKYMHDLLKEKEFLRSSVGIVIRCLDVIHIYITSFKFVLDEKVFEKGKIQSYFGSHSIARYMKIIVTCFSK